MMHGILPLIHNNIYLTNNTLYFTEIYVGGAPPVLWRTKIAPGMYSSSQVAEALQAALPAAAAVVPSVYNYGQVTKQHPEGEYTVLYDEVTSCFAIKTRSSAVAGIVVHPAPASAEYSVNISLGASEGGLTPVHITAPDVVAHRLSVYSLVDLEVRTGSRVVRIRNCMITRAPMQRSFVLDIQDSDLAEIMPPDSEELMGRVTVACSEGNIAGVIGFTLAVSDPVYAGTTVNILSQAPTATANQYVFSLDRAHYLEVGERILLDTGDSLVVDAVGSSTVVTVSQETALSGVPRSLRLQYAPDGQSSALVMSAIKADLTINLRVIYIELVLGKQIVGRLQSSRFSKRRYMSKILMDGDPNSVVYQTNAKATIADVDVPLGMADFNTVRLTLYDALENMLDFNDVKWSCVLEIVSRE
jgi:hypothetical protein